MEGLEWARQEFACVPESQRGGGQGSGDLSADLRRGVIYGDVGGLPLLLCPLKVLLRRSKVPKVRLHHPGQLIIAEPYLLNKPITAAPLSEDAIQVAQGMQKYLYLGDDL